MLVPVTRGPAAPGCGDEPSARPPVYLPTRGTHPGRPRVEADRRGARTRPDRPARARMDPGIGERGEGLSLAPPPTGGLGELARPTPRLVARAAVGADPVLAVIAPDDPDRVDGPLDAERPLFDRPSLATESAGRCVATGVAGHGEWLLADAGGIGGAPHGPRGHDIDGNDAPAVGRPFAMAPTTCRIPCMIPQGGIVMQSPSAKMLPGSCTRGGGTWREINGPDCRRVTSGPVRRATLASYRAGRGTSAGIRAPSPGLAGGIPEAATSSRGLGPGRDLQADPSGLAAEEVAARRDAKAAGWGMDAGRDAAASSDRARARSSASSRNHTNSARTSTAMRNATAERNVTLTGHPLDLGPDPGSSAVEA